MLAAERYHMSLLNSRVAWCCLGSGNLLVVHREVLRQRREALKKAQGPSFVFPA